MRLGVNIDHVATLRNARGTIYPSVVEAALVAETSGADLITLHLREDRRHIKDQDVFILREVLKTQMNLEMAVSKEMEQIALQVKPDFVCLVPEKREEVTTEGGLNIVNNELLVTQLVNKLQANNILVSLFIDPDIEQIKLAKKIGAYAIELHTGKYASSLNLEQQNTELLKIQQMAEYANSLGLVTNAGHGLHYHNVGPIAKIKSIHELNIGHAIIAQSVFVGLKSAIKEMKELMQESILNA